MAPQENPSAALDWIASWANPEREPEPSDPQDRLADLALRYGWVTPAQLDDIRRDAASSDPPASLGALLLSRGLLHADQLRYALCMLGGDSSRRGLQKIGRYEILGTLGQGGMGVVYRAVDPTLRREVALKVLPPDQGQDELARRRLLREATAIARLRHKNIVAVHEFGEFEGETFLAMEIVEGASLDAAWLPFGAVPLRRKIETLEKVTRAVAYAHEHGVVHRDLKPANVKLAHDGEPKVMDFGLARVEGEKTRLTMTGAVMGTPAYMAPEQVRGEKVGARADVYALGVMLYEALTGLLPFQANDLHEAYQKILNEEPIRPRKMETKIAVELEIVCLKAMEKDAARRYATAGELADDLERWLKGEPIRARPATWTTRITKRVKRNPWAWAGMVGATVVLVAGVTAVGVLTWSGSRRSRAQELAHQAGMAYARAELEEAHRMVEAALEIDPNQGIARYWRARLLLRQYQSARAMPEVSIASGLVEVLPSPPETEEQLRMRREIEAAFRGVPGNAIAQAVLALWDGRYEPAEEWLAQARREPEAKGPLAWELALLEALCLYGRQDFVAAEEKLRRYVGSNSALVDPIWGRLQMARGLEIRLTGQDPSARFESARAAGERLEEERPQEGRLLQARALVEWGKTRADRGDDPEEMYAQALGRLDGLSAAEARLTRGDALLARAAFRKSRGRIDPDHPTEYEEAINAYTDAIEAYPQYALARLRRGDARREFYQHQSAFGRHSVADLAQAVADYEQAQALSPGLIQAGIGHAWAKKFLAPGYWTSVDSRVAALRESIAELSTVVEETPPALRGSALLARSETYTTLGNYRESHGQDGTADLEAAVRDAGAALEISPSYAGAYYGRGNATVGLACCRQKRGVDPISDWEAAIADLRRAVSINRTLASGSVMLGFALTQLGLYRNANDQDGTQDLQAAIRAFSAGLETNPKNADLLAGRGQTHRYLARHAGQIGGDATSGYQAATADLLEALNINPYRAEIRRQYGVVLTDWADDEESRGQDPFWKYDSAISELTRVLGDRPEAADPNIMQDRARAYLARGKAHWHREHDPRPDFMAAIADSTKALEGDPRSVFLLNLRASAYTALASYRRDHEEDSVTELEAAVSDYDRIIEQNPDSPFALRERGWSRWYLTECRVAHGEDPTADYEAGIRDLRRAVDLDPSSSSAWEYLGGALWEFGIHRDRDRAMLEEALGALRRAVELDPQSADARYWYGDALLELGRAAEAIPELEAAVRLDPSLQEEIAPLLERARRDAAGDF